MTKDQYYNQPMYSWEKIDFKTRDECVALKIAMNLISMKMFYITAEMSQVILANI